ncbi:MAG: hypothetical protein WA738_03750 [Candidatus Angelobacter sp.]
MANIDEKAKTCQEKSAAQAAFWGAVSNSAFCGRAAIYGREKGIE